MFGLYIHIPYCRSKCRYCDFYSTPCPDGVPEAYIDALCREMDRFSPCGSTPLRPDTLYFGGGTPSLLTPAQAARLIRAAGPAPGAEITLEANPETVTPERLAAFRRAGVNRLSLGIQTARDDSLARLGRRHTAAQSRRALGMAVQSSDWGEDIFVDTNDVWDNGDHVGISIFPESIKITQIVES